MFLPNQSSSRLLKMFLLCTLLALMASRPALAGYTILSTQTTSELIGYRQSFVYHDIVDQTGNVSHSVNYADTTGNLSSLNIGNVIGLGFDVQTSASSQALVSLSQAQQAVATLTSMTTFRADNTELYDISSSIVGSIGAQNSASSASYDALFSLGDITTNTSIFAREVTFSTTSNGNSSSGTLPNGLLLTAGHNYTITYRSRAVANSIIASSGGMDFASSFIDFMGNISPHAVPEPSSLTLCGVALAGLTFWSWQRRCVRA